MPKGTVADIMLCYIVLYYIILLIVAISGNYFLIVSQVGDVFSDRLPERLDRAGHPLTLVPEGGGGPPQNLGDRLRDGNPSAFWAWGGDYRRGGQSLDSS